MGCHIPPRCESPSSSQTESKHIGCWMSEYCLPRIYSVWMRGSMVFQWLPALNICTLMDLKLMMNVHERDIHGTCTYMYCFSILKLSRITIAHFSNFSFPLVEFIGSWRTTWSSDNVLGPLPLCILRLSWSICVLRSLSSQAMHPRIWKWSALPLAICNLQSVVTKS